MGWGLVSYEEGQRNREEMNCQTSVMVSDLTKRGAWYMLSKLYRPQFSLSLKKKKSFSWMSEVGVPEILVSGWRRLFTVPQRCELWCSQCPVRPLLSIAWKVSVPDQEVFSAFSPKSQIT